MWHLSTKSHQELHNTHMLFTSIMPGKFMWRSKPRFGLSQDVHRKASNIISVNSGHDAHCDKRSFVHIG